MYNATGLSVNATAPTGSDSFTVTVEGFDTTATADTLFTGDTLDDRRRDLRVPHQLHGPRRGQRAVQVADGDADTVVGDALRDAINAQFAAGNTTIQATGTGAAVIATNSLLGNNGANLAAYYAATLTDADAAVDLGLRQRYGRHVCGRRSHDPRHADAELGEATSRSVVRTWPSVAWPSATRR